MVMFVGYNIPFALSGIFATLLTGLATFHNSEVDDVSVVVMRQHGEHQKQSSGKQ